MVTRCTCRKSSSESAGKALVIWAQAGSLDAGKGKNVKTLRLALLVFAVMGVLAISVRAQKPGPDAKKTTQKKIEPRKFGFTVVDVEVEKCCIDDPGEPTPTGQVSIMGHDPADWRFSLSCIPEAYSLSFTADGNLPATLTDQQKQVWTDVAVAAFAPIVGTGYTMLLYDAGDRIGTWKEVGRCFVNGDIEKAADTFGVYVTSSTYVPKKREYVLGVITTGLNADGKKMENMEALTLECTEGVQRPCVSVAPKVLWAVRNGSQIRLCDGDFSLIGTYRITSELPQTAH